MFSMLPHSNKHLNMCSTCLEKMDKKKNCIVCVQALFKLVLVCSSKENNVCES